MVLDLQPLHEDIFRKRTSHIDCTKILVTVYTCFGKDWDPLR